MTIIIIFYKQKNILHSYLPPLFFFKGRFQSYICCFGITYTMERLCLRKTIIALFILLCGVSSGCFLSIGMAYENKANLLSLLFNYLEDSNYQFFDNPMPATLFSCSLLLVVLFLLCQKMYLYPLALLLFYFKALSIGFSSALILEGFGLSGILTLLVKVFPQNVLIYIALIIIISLDYKDKSRPSHSIAKNTRHNMSKTNYLQRNKGTKANLLHTFKNSSFLRNWKFAILLKLWSLILIGSVIEGIIYSF